MHMPIQMHHLTVLLATICGIIGFGIVYDAVSSGSGTNVFVGIPMLLLGLWFVGRDLGMSNLAARRRRLLKMGRSSTTGARD
jgi:hypothetical protein